MKQKYFENSPMLQLDRIHTPILIAKGTNDAQIYATDQLFGGLKLLDRDAEYVKYEGGGHCVGQFGRRNDQDFVERMLRWFVEKL